MKTSDLLHDAFNRVSDPEHRCKNYLATNSMGFRTNPTTSDVERLSSIGSLMRSLNASYEDGTPTRTSSITQKLFFSNAWACLTQAAQQLGFRTATDLDEFGTDEQFLKMWEIAVSAAVMLEASESIEE